MNEQLERIRTKLEQLKILDLDYSLFGSNIHQYHLNPILTGQTIQQFESLYNVTLPKEYVDFLMHVGNGGAGPFLGLEPFEKILFVDLDRPSSASLLNPDLPFLHTQPWNEVFNATCDEEDEQEFERQYFEFHQHQMDGVIAISNYGCGISLNLVVNGQEYGYIWTDDRANEGGIYPSRELGNSDKLTFLDWYELWLDSSFAEMKEKQIEFIEQNQSLATSESLQHPDHAISNDVIPNIEKNKKPWWKFW